MAKKVNCPLCGKLADPNLEHCPHCGGPMRDASPGAKTAEQAGTPQETCPSCASPIREGDIICVRCGTNLLTGQKIAEEQQEVIKRQRNWQPYYVLAGVLAVAALAGGAAYFLTQDPLKEALRLAEEGNPLEGIEVLRKLVDVQPEHSAAQLALGKMNWSIGKYLDAADAFDAAFAAAPRDAEAGRLAVLAAGKIPGADGLNRQIAALRRLAEGHPDNHQARLLLGLALGAANDQQGQIGELRTLLERSPGEANAYQYLGVAEALAGDSTGAAKSLDVAARMQAHPGDTALARGVLSSMSGRTGDAALRLREALNTGSSVDAIAQGRLGLLYMEQGDYDQALALLSVAQSAPEIASTATFFHALCLQAVGLNEEARIEFERLVTADTEYAGDAAVRMALIYIETGENARAEASLKRAAQYGAASAEYHTIQGRLHVAQEEPSLAQQSFRNALRTNPDYPAAHLETGLLYIRRGVLEDGVRSLERYVALAQEGGGGRVNEIEMLVEQLKQTMDGGTQTAASF